MYSYGLAPGGETEQIFPALVAQAPVAGKEYTALNTVGTFTTAGTSVYGAFIPLKFSNAATVASLVLRAGVAYSGTALSFRLGIYSDNNGVPGALLIDAGTITWSGITLGQAVTIACSQALSANTQYWIVVGCAYASGAPSMHATVGNNKPFVDKGLMGELGGAGYYFSHNGANALPNPAPAVTAPAYLFPRVYVRLAS